MMSKHLVPFLVAASVALVGVACTKEDKQKERSASAAAAETVAKVDAAQAKEIFTSRCAACHGADGRGDGPGAAALSPKPRNYHDRDWQKSVSDEQIKKAITYGGAAIGKSPMMPASPDLDSKPEVVDGLVQLIRDLGKS